MTIPSPIISPEAFHNITQSLRKAGDAIRALSASMRVQPWWDVIEIDRQIRMAQQALRAAQWMPDGRTRHRAVKAARDELKRLHKLEWRSYR